MKLFATVAGKLDSFQKIISNIQSGLTPTLCVGLSSVHKAHFAYAAALTLDRPILLIAPDEPSAARLQNDINEMAEAECCLLFPDRDFSYRQDTAASTELEQARIQVLSRLVNGEVSIVVASVGAVLSRTIPPQALKENTLTVSPETPLGLEALARRLLAMGYSRRPQVDGMSQFSIRGGILDLYPPNETAPVRIEYWGDEIDTISHFDLDSQRRTDGIGKLHLAPAMEVLLSPDQLIERIKALIDTLGNRKATAAAKEHLLRDLDMLENGLSLNALDKYFPLAYDSFTTLLDYFPQSAVFVSEQSDCREAARAIYWQHSEDCKLLFEEGELCKGLDRYLLSPEQLEAALESHPLTYFDTFAHSYGSKIRDIINIHPLQSSGWNGDLNLLKSDIFPLLEQGYCCCILAGTVKAASTLASDLNKLGLPAQYVKDLKSIRSRSLFILAGTLSNGIEYPEIKFSLTTTARAATGGSIRVPKRRKGEEIRSLSDLVKGDYVVHTTHGIGIFDGIHKIDLHGITKDYIKIQYAGADTLYVPVTQLDLVAKYIGPREDSKVKLNRLHSGEWQKTRARVRKAVDEMADELIALYAKRMAVPGHAFSEDTEWQRDFEAHFAYQETDDQLRCIDEIKHDMERPVPMERLLCGDVGFGKTEVALRAAFKCVMDGKQCAILCPTTILAWQHYQTVLQRIGNFPVEVELLSRFRTPKQQKAVLDRLERGLVDIVIGTHRLVSKDVKFKNIGLAIIDEEQRFGVTHKERFKEMFTGVDMLTLSATPIPRTLNMAMSGIRDMSVIEEAPQNRHPVQTYVMEYDAGVIMEALKRELRRGGQVYYLHNNTESIVSCAAKIKNWLPEANIGIAHGKMKEEELSDVWKQLMEHEIDILVCTTIIETGVDVPNCNTLVIENADRMGLAQLYQLRGRIGRSSRRAYAYCTFQRGKALSEIATKRLSAIREFTKFGSGFRIALRDLEIRGAGNLLGTRQHGHMEAVGYDMYLRLLSEAVAAKRGDPEAAKPPLECQVDIQVNAHIPESYIDNLAQRIDIYRKIASIKTQDDALDVTDELIDRFGEPPAAVSGLVDIALLRNIAAQFGFKEIIQRGETLQFIPEEADLNLFTLLASKLKGRGSVSSASTPAFVLKLRGQQPLDGMREVVTLLEEIRDHNPLNQL